MFLSSQNETLIFYSVLVSNVLLILCLSASAGMFSSSTLNILKRYLRTFFVEN